MAAKRPEGVVSHGAPASFGQAEGARLHARRPLCRLRRHLPSREETRPYSAIPSSYSADMVSHLSSFTASVCASCERSLARRVAVEGSFS